MEIAPLAAEPSEKMKGMWQFFLGSWSHFYAWRYKYNQIYNNTWNSILKPPISQGLPLNSTHQNNEIIKTLNTNAKFVYSGYWHFTSKWQKRTCGNACSVWCVELLIDNHHQIWQIRYPSVSTFGEIPLWGQLWEFAAWSFAQIGWKHFCCIIPNHL